MAALFSRLDDKHKPTVQHGHDGAWYPYLFSSDSQLKTEYGTQSSQRQ